MNPALWLHHLEHMSLSRREALGFGAKLGTAGVLATFANAPTGAADDDRQARVPQRSSGREFNDEVFDYADRRTSPTGFRVRTARGISAALSTRSRRRKPRKHWVGFSIPAAASRPITSAS
jgi:hypothetical protein